MDVAGEEEGFDFDYCGGRGRGGRETMNGQNQLSKNKENAEND